MDPNTRPTHLCAICQGPAVLNVMGTWFCDPCFTDYCDELDATTYPPHQEEQTS